MDTAKVLASRGFTVTIVMTPEHATKFKNDIADNPIHFLEPESFEKGGPTDAVTWLLLAANELKGVVEDWLHGLKTTSLPDCIVSDMCITWTSEVCHKFGIPKVVFHTVSCFTLLCSHNVSTHKPHDKIESELEFFHVPGVPDRIMLTKAQLPEATMTGSADEQRKFIDEMKKAEQAAEGVMINSFEEMEAAYVSGYKEVVKKDTWCIGPLPLWSKTTSFNRGDKASIHEHECPNWLDSKKEKSVIYVCFGSISRLGHKQLMELGSGLESSGCSFIWVIKKADCSVELEEWFENERFEEKIKGRGLIIRGWAPQVLILSHPSVCGFLTHCGWNSTLEGVSSGVPMLTWPMFAEQFYNENFIVEVLKIGVRVGMKIPMQQGEKEKEIVLVTREDVERAVKKVVDGGEEGEKRRIRAQKLQEMAKTADRKSVV